MTVQLQAGREFARVVCVLVSLLVAGPGTVWGAELFVATNGNDSTGYPGDMCGS